jgi:hypothetical protein
MVTKDDPRIQYGDLFGFINLNDKCFDDNEELKYESLNYKITNIKIYFNSKIESEAKKNLVDGEENEPIVNNEPEEDKESFDEKYIVGLTITYKNIYNGETKVMEHKFSDKIGGMKELKIEGNEYVKKFGITVKDDFKRVSQICFYTNKNHCASVGVKEGDDKIEKLNDKDNVIVGCFGHYEKSLNCFGCIYVDKNIFIKKLVFGFLYLRNKVKKDEKFRKEWEEKYKELDIDFQFLWKFVNLPDTSFAKIISFCFI